MMLKVLVFYGSYRQSRVGIRLANYALRVLGAEGFEAELIDARAINLPMLDRMYKEYAPGTAPPAMETLAAKIRSADAFLFVCGEYNWGMQPGLKNLTDHFLEEWFWRPAAIISYSAQRTGGARASWVACPFHASRSPWRSALSRSRRVIRSRCARSSVSSVAMRNRSSLISVAGDVARGSTHPDASDALGCEGSTLGG